MGTQQKGICMNVPKIRFGTGRSVWKQKLGNFPPNIHRKSVKHPHKVKTPSKPESPEAWLRKQIEDFDDLRETRDKIVRGERISDLEREWYNECMCSLLSEMTFHDPEIMKLFNL